MVMSPILLFSISLLFTSLSLKIFGNKFALDHPDSRKHHEGVIPQIGGLIFGILFLFILWWFDLAPAWYILGGSISIFLGIVDDNFHISWKIKFIVQLCIAIYLSSIFWGQFKTISFYNLSFAISEYELVLIFLFWFIGIYNSVNLIDGLDGLAGGFMLILCMVLFLSGSNPNIELNFILSVIILGFLVFNQRPAKLFMGDAGSLFFGFHAAVLPLLFSSDKHSGSVLDMTPFILLVSYLIADTSRVFFTRILNKKNPMTADTIHFHHLILQKSGSYLSSIGSIYFIALLCALSAILSFHQELSINFMLIHLSLVLFFILSPPIETYVPIIVKAVAPLYKWQKNQSELYPFLPRTLFMLFLICSLLFSLIYHEGFLNLITWQQLIAMLLVLIFMFFHKKDQMAKYVLQLSFVLFFAELYWNTEFNIFTKLFTAFLLLSYSVFTIEKRVGCKISKFSSLDLLIIIIVIGAIALSLFGFQLSIWFSLIMLSLWFGISFIINRSEYFNNQ
jgi:UDP-GlcNAc:undecaprenyl-phosphate/decaprenyl-phosphate GlcNAc-1-phosphate transferase